MIRLSNVDLTYGQATEQATLALHDVNLDIRKNEILTIVGASGCGKSTLLRLIAGLLLPTRGEVLVNGQPVREPRRDTGIVFQAPTLVPWATILDNVLLPQRIVGRVSLELRERAQRLLRTAGLGEFTDRLPRQLSGGMQQRAAICRALVHNPDILLMDEPFGALDALTRETMTLELMRIWAEEPKTIVFVTHSITEAVLLGDRVVVMSPRPGVVREIVQVGLPRPRRFKMEADPEFVRCAERVRELIFTQEEHA